MTATREGGLAARDKLLAADPDYYKKLGAIGGKNGHTGGFYANRELASRAGRIGGKISRQPKQIKEVQDV